MLHLCPVCQRSFDEPGFCPFDRAQLILPAGRDQQALVSGVVAAATPHATDVEPRRNTFPLTQTPPSSAGPRAGPAPAAPAAPPAPSTTPRVRAAPDDRPGATAADRGTRASLGPGGTPPDASTWDMPPAAPEEPSKIRAVSASDDPKRALEAYQARHDSEYDRLVGQTLDGRYHVEAKIGEGGMGVVFSARHAVIERPLAVKVLKREVMRDTATIRRFVQEAKAASRIGHPNIVDVTDFGTTPDGMTYSVMEFVNGQTLGAALRQASPFPIPRAIRIAAQIARALGAAHDKGIIHRDLKPENVFLVDRDGRPDFVKIVDFGIAKVLPIAGATAIEPRLTRAGTVFGTPEYMAPEQAAGRSDTDGRVDVYALGVILYEMITGRVPHRGETLVRTLAMQMLDPVVPPSQVRPDVGITPEVDALILKALAKKRDQRFQTMGELLAALDQLQTPVGVSITGSPVYALQPLPPGADPSLRAAPGRTALAAPPFAGPVAIPGGVSGLPAPAVRAILPGGSAGVPSESVPIAIPPISQPADPLPPLPAPATARRLKDEPEFVVRDKPVTFEHVFTDEHAAPRGRRWSLLVLFALILGGASAAIALMIKSRDRVARAEHRDAGAPMVDGAPLAIAEDTAEPAPDAAAIVVVEPDAGVRIAIRPRDAGSAGVVVTPNGRGTIGIQVLTKPEGATLYVGTLYRGPGGTQLEEPFGTKLEVTCKHAGYKPGVVRLVFDGKREAELCVLQRIKICIPEVKNPFDDCEPEAAPR